MTSETGTHVELDATIAALSSGPTQLNPTTAIDTINSWRKTLSASGKPELTAIADQLGELKVALSQGGLDGKRIGAALTRLGEQTSAAAQHADGSVSSKLVQLGGLLSKAGQALS